MEDQVEKSPTQSGTGRLSTRQEQVVDYFENVCIYNIQHIDWCNTQYNVIGLNFEKVFFM